MRLLQLQRQPDDQYMYRIRELPKKGDAYTIVDWQYGMKDRSATIDQAKSRFGSDMEVEDI